MQVNTLKQIRSAYDELSTGYQKLLTASELFNRDTLLQVDPEGVAAGAQRAHPEGVVASPLQMRTVRKAGLLSEGEECSDTTHSSSAAHYTSQHHHQQKPPQQQQNHEAQKPAALLTPVRPVSPKKSPILSEPDSSSSSRTSNARQLATTLVRRLTFIPNTSINNKNTSDTISTTTGTISTTTHTC